MKTKSGLLSHSSALALFLYILALPLFLNCQSHTTSLQKTRTKADETAILGTLRTIATAQRAYALSTGGDYGSFQQLTESGFLDERFNSEKPVVQDYVLTMSAEGKEFSCNADPAGDQEGRHFYLDSTSPLIHVNPSKPASASDPVYQP